MWTFKTSRLLKALALERVVREVEQVHLFLPWVVPNLELERLRVDPVSASRETRNKLPVPGSDRGGVALDELRVEGADQPVVNVADSVRVEADPVVVCA